MEFVWPDKGVGGLYLLKLSDEHYYGGSTKSFRWRWYEHLRTLKKGTHRNPHMQAVFNQHRRFEPQVLEVSDAPRARLLLEQAWLDKNFGKPGCVNLCAVAEGVMEGRTHSPAARAKMAAAKRGRKLSEEHRQALSEAQKRRHSEGTGFTAETRAKISRSNRGRKRPDVTQRNRDNTGWTHSVETRGRISEAGRRPCSEETKQKISATHKFRGTKPPTGGMRGHRLSKALRENFDRSPEAAQRRSEARKRSWETRRKK